MQPLPNFKPQPLVDGRTRIWDDLKYDKVEILGKGRNRTCWRAHFPEGYKAVVKEYFNETNTQEIAHYLRVIETLKGHPAVVHTETTFWTESDSPSKYKFFQIQTAYDSTLLEEVKSQLFIQYPHLIKSAFQQLADGLAFIHGKGVIVNDIKLDNIFCSLDYVGSLTGTFVYGDFDGADLKEARAPRFIYTNTFIAPSRLEDRNSTCADDIHSLGVCFAYIQYNNCHFPLYPFDAFTHGDATSLPEAYESFINKLHESPYKPLIKRMLAYLRSERPDAEQIRTEVKSLP